jgi:hypothetical protein
VGLRAQGKGDTAAAAQAARQDSSSGTRTGARQQQVQVRHSTQDEMCEQPN